MHIKSLAGSNHGWFPNKTGWRATSSFSFFPQVVEILVVSIKTLTSPGLKTLKIIFKT